MGRVTIRVATCLAAGVGDLTVRVLVTGAGGLVGGALASSLVAGGHDVFGAVRTRPASVGVESRTVELDRPGAFDGLMAAVRPDVVVHAAYSTAALDRDVVAATVAVAEGCDLSGTALVHLSTDAVFDGEHAPYSETDTPEPVHPYGIAKRSAELTVLEQVPDAAVVRVALVAHLDPERPDAASRWLRDATRRGELVTLFTDEIRTVVRLDDLVGGLHRIAELDRSERAGIWHLGGPDALSRADLGRIVIERFGLDDTTVRLGSSSDVEGPRPRDVSMSCERARVRLGWAPRPVDTVTAHGQGP